MSTRSKPDARTAMYQLIETIRHSLPFEDKEARLCQDSCNGCSLKLLDYLESELEQYQSRLDDGDPVGFADLSRLIKTASRVRAVLEKNGLLAVAGKKADPLGV